MFKGPVYKAVLAKVLEKIDAAEETFEKKVEQHNEAYQSEVDAALRALNVKKELALQEAVKSVIQ